MINIITNSLIITKYINITYQHVYFWQPGFKKGDNWNANRTHPFIFSWSAIIGTKQPKVKSPQQWRGQKTCTRICRFLVVGNIFQLETCMNSLVKVSPNSKWIFTEKFSSPKTGVILLLKLWVWNPFIRGCTRYNTMW